jgi:serine/threonine protein kinase
LDNPNPNITTVRHIVEQVARGLQAFHRQEMVHQDLRPNNVMVDDEGVVKIIDFGATKVAGNSEQASFNEGLEGTLLYSAPEYFLGNDGSNRSDIYSLGVITYQMLSGKFPYGTGVSNATTAAKQRNLRFQLLTDYVPKLPVWVEEAVKKAVTPNPIKRYGEISEFIHDLNHPNKLFLDKTRPPLIERNPVLFWQSTSFILFVAVVVQFFQGL